MAQLFFLLSALAAASALRPGGLYLGIDLSTQSCTAVVTARARQSRRGGATISTPRRVRAEAPPRRSIKARRLIRTGRRRAPRRRAPPQRELRRFLPALRHRERLPRGRGRRRDVSRGHVARRPRRGARCAAKVIITGRRRHLVQRAAARFGVLVGRRARVAPKRPGAGRGPRRGRGAQRAFRAGRRRAAGLAGRPPRGALRAAARTVGLIERTGGRRLETRTASHRSGRVRSRRLADLGRRLYKRAVRRPRRRAGRARRGRGGDGLARARAGACIKAGSRDAVSPWRRVAGGCHVASL